MKPRTLLAASMLVIAACATAEARAQSAKGLVDKMLSVESQRAKGVSDYAMDVTTMGNDITLFYERVSARAPNGKTIETFRLVSSAEIQERQMAGQGMSPEAWQAYSEGLRETGSAMEREIDQGMTEAGLPSGTLDALGSGSEAEPWASPNPGTMMGAMADFAEAAGQASAQSASEADGSAINRGIALFRERAKVVGKESLGKQRAIHARAEGLNLTEKANGGELVIDAISLWIDPDKYVPLKLRLEGVAKEKGKSREVFIERLDHDYQTVPGSALYLPYRTTVRMHGMLDADQQRQMEDARKQLDELDAQLAAMPPEERAQFEKMAGAQIERLRTMVNSGDMEVATRVRDVRINTGLAGAFPVPEGASLAASTAPTSTGTMSADSLLSSIQRDLVALGYDPGNIEGELSTETIVAISKFQADNGLEVTGEPTPQLAGILASQRDAGGSPVAPGAQKEPSVEDAQAACLQAKVDAAKKKKRAFGNVMRAVGSTASRYGGVKVSSEVQKASEQAYKVDATTKDLEQAANELGLSKEDVESCQKPK